MHIIADKYEVERELGGGSYGKVYLVRHIDLGARYALKLLNRSLSEEGKFIERFKREAEILRRFSHPGSVPLRDFGRTADGLYYMATDYSEGETLSAIMDRESWFPVLMALDITMQTLSVLEAAHTLGVIHRDIKPANIMIETDAQGKRVVRVLDFGIAKLHEEVTASGSATAEGFAIGTPEYMSPEQASGSNVDARTDIYSTGVVLYEMITGEVPFRGHTVVQTLLKQLTQPPPPFAERLGIPGYIETLASQALAKELPERFHSAAQFRSACLEALRELEREQGVVVRPDEVPSAPEPVATPSVKPKLLCLDDTEMVLQMCRHVFENEGFEVITATSFSSIHDYVFVEDIAVMLCDVQMPGLPGPRICQMIKKVKPELKIILFSNIDERQLEKLAKVSSADTWLSKNRKPSEWVSTVREVIAAGGNADV